MHLSGLIIRTGHEKENSQTSKNIDKKKIDVIYQFSLRKHSAKAVSSGFFIYIITNLCIVLCRIIIEFYLF